jgi:hypothetical protein
MCPQTLGFAPAEPLTGSSQMLAQSTTSGWTVVIVDGGLWMSGLQFVSEVPLLEQ